MIYLDMDGVLCDLTTAALRHFEREDLLGNWPVGVYRLSEALGITEDEFGRQIDTLGIGFWAELERYPWADELVAMLEEFDDVAIASKPMPGHYSPAGKVLWLQRHFGGRFANPDRYQLGGVKAGLARAGSILIDDSDENVDAFRHEGGLAVLFPQLGNSARAAMPATPAAVVDYVRKAVARAVDKITFGLRREGAR